MDQRWINAGEWELAAMKIYQDFNQNNEPSGLAFFCKGCKQVHVVNTDPSKRWGFNGDFENPTLTPSILVNFPANPNAGENFKEWRTARVCHSYVTDGNIQYLSDCTHELAGQTIELPEFKWDDEDD